MSELKPSPFCGSADVTVEESVYTYIAMCNGCGVESREHFTEAEAVAAWNRRTEAPTPPPCDAAALAGTWPGDVDDGFEAMVDEHRHGRKGGNDA